MGKAAVPLKLADLEKGPDHWFIALYEITGANPVTHEHRGYMQKMADDWIAWGKENGFKW
jgi:hypothetical protein